MRAATLLIRSAVATEEPPYFCTTRAMIKLRVGWTTTSAGGIRAVRRGSAQVAFLLNATRLEQMRDIAYEGNVMPQKSTDFYPKVLSGLTMYTLE